MSVLDTITQPEDIRNLSEAEEAVLCEEIRQFLINTISKTGGHLASNLGIVELTIAIHKVFDTSRDRLIFDVGHQSYVHKILTGRRERFNTLRRYGGLSGFPKPSESVHDAFIAGHASNAVSVAMGMARARTLLKEDYHVIALLGDGALTGGLAYEGLNDAGQSKESLIVILNDNGMSITENVGGMAKYLSHLRLKPNYFRFKKAYHKFVKVVPGGRHLYRFTHIAKQRIKNALLGVTMFEEMGFTYLGPIDGHDIAQITYLLNQAKELGGPVLLHVTTTKGKGYKYSEENPDEFHGISCFDIASGKLIGNSGKSFSQEFGECLNALADENPKVCAITAAMQQGTGLEGFALNYPDRFFDVGIAEGHAVSMAAGMAKQGMIPVFAVYSSFLQRGYDMLIHDVSLMGLHVVFAVDRAGLVGEDGETHNGLFDVGYLRQIPQISILCPASLAELSYMLRQAVFHMDGPVAVRYPRGGEGRYTGLSQKDAEIILEGSDFTIITYGTGINAALDASDLLKKRGISIEVVKLNSIAPIDYPIVFASMLKTKRVMVVEDCVCDGSVGQALGARVLEEGIHLEKFILKNLGRRFIPQGTMKELYQQCGLDGRGIANAVLEDREHETTA